MTKAVRGFEQVVGGNCLTVGVGGFGVAAGGYPMDRHAESS
jgi:hypothetical protein